MVFTRVGRVERRGRLAIYTAIFIAALFTIAEIWNQPRCLSSDKWINKGCFIYIYTQWNIIHL